MGLTLAVGCAAALIVGCADDAGEGDTEAADAGGSMSATAGDAGDGADGTMAPEPEVWCGDDMTCSGTLGTCCFQLDITVLDIVGRCVYEPGACTMEESYVSCDERADCGATPCCMSSININMKERYMGECGTDPMGCGFADELCQGQGAPGVCTNDAFCCQADGDAFGTCVADQATCDEMQAMP